MRIALLIGILASLVHAASVTHVECVVVSSDRITAADLAPAIPVFQTLDPATSLGFAPMPGTQRTLSARELSLLAERHGLALDGIVSAICVERLVHPISRSEFETALVAALGIPDAELELVEFSSQPLPPGRLEFQRSGLGKAAAVPADTPALWRGRLLYDGQRSIGVWAKVRITVNGRQFVATEDIPAGAVIRAEQVKEIEARQSPFLEATPAALAEIAGKLARRKIAAGERIMLRVLDQPKEVRSGEMVHVKVVDGLAVLSFDAIAQGGGKTGDAIWVHNPSGGKNFRAVIEQKGKVVVRTAPGD